MKVFINPGHDTQYDSGAVNPDSGLRECDVAELRALHLRPRAPGDVRATDETGLRRGHDGHRARRRFQKATSGKGIRIRAHASPSFSKFP